MKEFILNQLPPLGKYPIVLQSLDYLDFVTSEINRCTEKYENWQLILASMLITYVIMRFLQFWNDLDYGLADYLKKRMFKLLKLFPFLNRKIMSELEKTKRELEEDIMKANKGNLYLKELPPKGLDEKSLFQKIDQYLSMSTTDWKSGTLSGCVYGADENLTKLTTKVYERFAWSNPMHADVFPDVRKMEAEVVRWVCNLFNGDENTCGTMTTGGTESIMLACKAYRDLAISKGIKKPEMVIPETAHAAFDKAAHFFKIKLNHVPVNPVTKRVDPNKLKSYINSNTCMIVGSSPNFPHGAIDPIEELSNVALKYKVPLHVDACLGGFLVIFMEKAGYKLPLFDFRLKGVTSISCDTHKYGYSPKGSSVIMYRNSGLRKFQYFSCVEWPGGIYVSPTFAGSRAGSLIAMTWATLLTFGVQGYVETTKKVIEITRYLAKEIASIKELKLMCQPDVSVVSFDSTEFNILHVLDEMASKGWHLNALQNPTGMHIAVTKMHTAPGVAERFVKDLKQCVKDIMGKDDRKNGKTAAIYCSTASVPDKSIVADVAYLFLDACYSTKNAK